MYPIVELNVGAIGSIAVGFSSGARNFSEHWNKFFSSNNTGFPDNTVYSEEEQVIHITTMNWRVVLISEIIRY